jgi:hypothetical protein
MPRDIDKGDPVMFEQLVNGNGNTNLDLSDSKRIVAPARGSSRWITNELETGGAEGFVDLVRRRWVRRRLSSRHGYGGKEGAASITASNLE